MTHSYRYDDRANGHGSDHLAARALGWFSLALGATELLAPGRVNRALGLGRQDGLVRSYGVREMISGLGLLSQSNPSLWAWSRVAGDAVDLATLAAKLDRRGGNRSAILTAMVAVGAITALDVAVARSLSREARQSSLRRRERLADYRTRSGLPRPPQAMRGAALRDGGADAPPPRAG
jgi:hypothetical protein